MSEAGFADDNTGANSPLPKTLIQAYSEIQNLWLVEKQYDKGLPPEYVTMTQVGALSRIGMKSAGVDTIVWFLGGFISSLLIFALVPESIAGGKTDTPFGVINIHPLLLFAYLAGYSRIVISTMLTGLVCRYYCGRATARAITYLVTARISTMFTAGILSFVLCAIIAKGLKTPAVYKVAYFICHHKQQEVYDFLSLTSAKAFESAVNMAIVAGVSVAFTAVCFVFFMIKNRRKKELSL